MGWILLAILAAVAIDRFVPDRFGFKPFAWYRDWAESIEQRFNGGKRNQGIGAVLLATLPIVFGAVIVRYVLGEIAIVLRFAFDVLVLYFCLDIYRLGKTGSDIAESLQLSDLEAANENLVELNGKGAPEMHEASIARSAIEAILRQGNALIVSPIFWFVLLGPAGALLQRLSSILDMLWGHRYDRFVEFGWMAARLDDVLGWVPARITAISYAIMGSFEDALRCWRQRMSVWSDINSGPLLASGLGAMHMQSCEVEAEVSEYEGDTEAVIADAGHVRRAVALVWRVMLFWLAIGILMSVMHFWGWLGA